MASLHGPIKGIFLDLGWTVMYPPSGDWLFSPFAKSVFTPEKMASLPQDALQAALQKGADYLRDHHLMSTTEEEYQRFYHYYQLLAETFPSLGITPRQLQEVAEEKVYNMDNYVRFEDTISTLETLSKSYRLGIISDTYPSVATMLKNMELEKYFQSKTFSFDLGVYKPHPAMYEDALKKMDLPPEETVFVDDLQGNLEGAGRYGIQGVLICVNPQTKPTDAFPSISKISQLLEVLP